MIPTLSYPLASATTTTSTSGSLSRMTTLGVVAAIIVLGLAWFLLNRNKGQD